MATTLTSTGITFPDSTTQTTAATGRSGTTTTTSGTSISLSSSSTQQQNIKFTAADLYVTLPNATTLSNSANTFVITNLGNELVTVKNYGGDILGFVVGSVSLSLVDNSTTSGTWTADSRMCTFSPTGVSFSFSSTYVSDEAVVRTVLLSDTLGLVFYKDSSSNWRVCAYSISGGSITFGSSVALASSTSYSPLMSGAFVALSSTTGVFAMWDLSSTIYGWGISVSGTTVSVGGRTNIGTNGSNGASLAKISSTTFAVVTYPASVVSVRVCTLSGTTITSGTLYNSAYGPNSNYFQIAYTTNGTGLVRVMSGYGQIIPFTVSGTTISFGTAYVPTIAPYTIYGYSQAAPFTDSTEPNRVYFSGFVVDVSGTTVTKYVSTGLNYTPLSIYRSPLGQARALYTSGSGHKMTSLTVSPRDSVQSMSDQQNGSSLGGAMFGEGFITSQYEALDRNNQIAISGTTVARLINPYGLVNSVAGYAGIEIGKILA